MNNLLMQINRHDKDLVEKLLISSEDRLIELILKYAEQQKYTRYTSTLKEAWRLSIDGLSQSIIKALEISDLVPGLGPDEDFSSDPGAQFGIMEAQRHRARGVNLTMFLGLMKYYRQAYLDLLDETPGIEHPKVVKLLVNRFYDRIELAYCGEWMSSDGEVQIKALSDSNLHLTNEKNKYLTLFESLSSPVILCDERGNVDNYNDAAGRLLLGTTTPGSRYYSEQRHDLAPPALQQELAQMIAEGSDLLGVEKVYLTPEGDKTYDVQIERMLDVSQKFSGYTILFNDITERLSWSRQLEEVNRSQQQLIDDLNQTRQQLIQSEKMAAVGQLSAGIAHEINTPIQYIEQNTRFLRDAFSDMQSALKSLQKLLAAAGNGELSENLLSEVCEQVEEADCDYLFDEVPGAVEQSLEGVERVSTIVSAMKVFARSGTQEKVEIDINAAIMSSVNLTVNEWKYHSEVEMDLDPDLPMIRCVPSDLNQSLLNIVVNAATANSDQAIKEALVEKGRISIRSRLDGDWVVIEIGDTGTGIPEGIKTKIFDPFFTTREVGKGIGQGLTFVYQAIVEEHGGRVKVDSTLGEGAIFEIRLPILPDLISLATG
ncbi:MAG: ATP-binding protein [Candidatus Thiodiazotropha sp. LLP2]